MITVVGASLAGLRAVETLRDRGYDGPITVVGEEPHLPYDRPPLSKQVLAGTWEPDRVALTPIGRSIDDLDVEWRVGEVATSLDLGARTVALAGGGTVPWDQLLIATGARVRRLPDQPELEGIHTLRTLDDCLALKAAFDATPSRVVVVGAGFIGAEVAATARGLGLEVTLLEALAVPLERVLGLELGGLCAEIHRDHGVDLRLATGVAGFVDDGRGHVAGVRLSDGEVVEADVVVVGVGVQPNTEWLDSSGLPIENGVLCDETCLAAPDVVAAGDVARWRNVRFDEVMRVEHWENAQDQAAHAARRLLGETEPYAPVPWFWSDQYDRKIQLAGRSRPDDEMVVIDGSLAERRFAALFGRDGKLVGVLGMNRPRPVMQYRQMILDGVSFEDAVDSARRA